MAHLSNGIALVGAKGMLARKVIELAPAGTPLYLLDLPEFDVTDGQSVDSQLQEIQPGIIINCAAFTNVDGCETAVDAAFAVNGEGPGLLARAALSLDATLVHISTDYVFPGTGSAPLQEDDPTGPPSVYGQSKLSGEQEILASGLQRYLIVRTSWLYGPGGKNFVETIVRLAAERKELGVVADQIGSPTYTGDLARAIYTLIGLTQDRASGYGTYHFANSGYCSWFEFAQEIVAQSRRYGGTVVTEELRPLTTEEYPLPAPRPQYSVLDTLKYRQATGQAVPGWQKSLAHYFIHDRN